MKKYHVGLVIGRFQPFHLGHKYLIEKALEHTDKIIIGIGSSDTLDEKNPYGLEARMQFVKKFLQEEKLEKKVLKIVAIPDVPDDDEWYTIAEKQTGPVDVVIGDNDWTNGIYRNHGAEVLEIGFHKRHILEGTKIRKNMREKKPWKERVPPYLHKHIK